MPGQDIGNTDTEHTLDLQGKLSNKGTQQELKQQKRNRNYS